MANSITVASTSFFSRHQRLKQFLKRTFDPIICWSYRTFCTRRSFEFNGESYSYFYHPYNSAWKTERGLEIPLVWKVVQAERGSVLEVGNVLSHYFPIKHDVLDKYEKAPGVVNEDIVSFAPGKKYDLIVAISTLEHVGWDEQPMEPMKLLPAIDNLLSLLRPGGKIMITVPIGCNTTLDSLIRQKIIKFDETYCFKRFARDCQFKQVAWKEISHAHYDSPFPLVNAVVLGIYNR
jgi:hypothetical protein